jgi:hypothetical protein
MARKRRRKQSAVVAVILLLNICITSCLAFLSQRCEESLTRVSPYSATRLLLERPTGAENPLSLVHNTTISARRRRQTRRKPTNRRPKYYWTDLKNVERELREFWTSNGDVTIAATVGDNIDIDEYAYANEPPLIPNNQLLNHYQRHDLRAAIYAHGGRERLAASLGAGARIMPGRWTDAVQESPELRKLLQIDPSLSAERPPFSPRQGDTTANDDINTDIETNTDHANYTDNDEDDPEGAQEETSRSGRWLHQSGRKPKGYWSLRVVIQELYVTAHDLEKSLVLPVFIHQYIVQSSTTYHTVQCSAVHNTRSHLFCYSVGTILHNTQIRICRRLSNKKRATCCMDAATKRTSFARSR